MRRNLILALVLIAISVWLINWTGNGSNFFTSFMDRVTLGLRRVAWGDRVGNKTSEEMLKEQVAGLQYQVGELSRLTEENKLLREQLNIQQDLEREKVVANVVGGGHGVVRIDQGKRAGVVNGASAVVGKALLGRVTGVTDWGATVALVHSSDFKLTVNVVGAVSGVRRASGIVTGGAGKVKLTKVLRDEVVAAGDIVVSAGSEGETVGLVIGSVEEIKEGDGVYQEATVVPAVDLGKLTQIFILK